MIPSNCSLSLVFIFMYLIHNKVLTFFTVYVRQSSIDFLHLEEGLIISQKYSNWGLESCLGCEE